ncbi:MAG: histidinol-phosphatase [Clostridia bacterium]|nr:histidinol-phosphatase [Clostridia bacterium]
MIPTCNLHAHTTFCDGKNTAEEMVRGAIALGCTTLGLSGHSPLSFADWCMKDSDLDAYRQEIARLRKQYEGQIELLCGIEYDILSTCSTEGYDYIIGSVHHVVREGIYLPVDGSIKMVVEGVEQLFGNDYIAYARAYYEQMYDLCDRTKCDIVGHFDLLTKHNENDELFDTGDRRYRQTALEALDDLLEQDKILELNTGAISRGYRTTPYPAPFLLRYIAEKKGRVMINSDSHAADTILFAYAEAVEYAKSCGIRELTVYQNGGFDVIGI